MRPDFMGGLLRAAGRAALVLVLGFVLAREARAGEVTLANGDVLHGRTWREGRILHLEHAVLGEIEFSPQHYQRAELDDLQATEPSASPALPAAGAAGLAPLCTPVAVVDPALTPKCPSPFDFAIGAGASFDGGNTDKQQLNLDADAEYRWRQGNALTFRTTNFYERANGIQTEGKYFGSLRYQRDLGPRSYLFGLWLAQRDDFSDILLRTGWMVGAGRYLIKRENESLKVEVGGGWTHEERKGQPRLDTASAYCGLNWKRTFQSKDYIEAHAWTVQYLDEHGLSPYQLQLRYGHPIRAHLDITASFLLDYVDSPPAGIRSEDTKFVVGLRWRPTEKSR